MTIFIAAWHYWARMVVQRTWGWSPVEELVLLHVDKTPGTIDSIRTDLSLSAQVVGATIARLMQFGLVELRMSPSTTAGFVCWVDGGCRHDDER